MSDFSDNLFSQVEKVVTRVQRETPISLSLSNTADESRLVPLTRVQPFQPFEGGHEEAVRAAETRLAKLKRRLFNALCWAATNHRRLSPEREALMEAEIIAAAQALAELRGDAPC